MFLAEAHLPHLKTLKSVSPREDHYRTTRFHRHPRDRGRCSGRSLHMSKATCRITNVWQASVAGFCCGKIHHAAILSPPHVRSPGRGLGPLATQQQPLLRDCLGGMHFQPPPRAAYSYTWISGAVHAATPPAFGVLAGRCLSLSLTSLYPPSCLFRAFALRVTQHPRTARQARAGR